MKNKNENILDRLSRIAFITAIIGVCTIGICPAFAAIGIVVPAVMKSKKAPISQETKSRNKKAFIAGIISIIMFVVDLVIVVVLNSQFNWF
ncbi:MAG: hypothetical protein K2G22_02695 [Eubacterium sp.]|nr:hypothetical protein [Eubacterium sp.]